MSLSARYRQVKERIARAAEAAGRDPADVTLIAVSKTHPVEKIKALADLGQVDFGESRLQEATPKIEVCPGHLRWHFIGKLQSNKAKRAAQMFDVIHTLESEAQLKEIAKAGRAIDGLIEVNLARESQKSGIFADELETYVEKLLQYRQVHFRGLMTIGPSEAPDEEQRRLYRQLRELGERFQVPWLSAGMSDDAELAIQEGSTHVRIGTAIFGDRD